jgi:hypothetical protein
MIVHHASATPQKGTQSAESTPVQRPKTLH